MKNRERNKQSIIHQTQWFANKALFRLIKNQNKHKIAFSNVMSLQVLLISSEINKETTNIQSNKCDVTNILASTWGWIHLALKPSNLGEQWVHSVAFHSLAECFRTIYKKWTINFRNVLFELFFVSFQTLSNAWLLLITWNQKQALCKDYYEKETFYTTMLVQLWRAKTAKIQKNGLQ